VSTSQRLGTLAICATALLAAPSCTDLVKLPFKIAFGVTEGVVSVPVGLVQGVAGISSTPPQAVSTKSPSGDVLAAYERSVAQWTERYTRTASDEDFVVGLEAVAKEHGIQGWEQVPETYRGIGAGLRTAGLERPGFERVQSAIAPVHPSARDFLAEGYDTG
jgi:hypothetical protein